MRLGRNQLETAGHVVLALGTFRLLYLHSGIQYSTCVKVITALALGTATAVAQVPWMRCDGTFPTRGDGNNKDRAHWKMSLGSSGFGAVAQAGNAQISAKRKCREKGNTPAVLEHRPRRLACDAGTDFAGCRTLSDRAPGTQMVVEIVASSTSRTAAQIQSAR